MANYILLERIELNASAASITFANIPQTGYTDLLIKFSSRDDSGSAWNNLNLTFNGSGTYSSISAVGTGTGTTSQSASAINRQYTNGGSTTTNTFGNGEIYITNYNVLGIQKTVSSDTVGENNSSTSIIGFMAGNFTSTAAITTITLAPLSQNFVANSTFSLYGIASLGTSPAIAPKATGGNTITTDGTYWYHAFLASGTFTPVTSLTADVLTIAGGGGGGENNGGGGAGGLLGFSSQSLSATNYTVTVGAGGAGYAQPLDSAGDNGSNSQFGSLTAAIGGGGGGSSANPAKDGGSGGGSTSGGTVVGLGTVGQGNNGGQGIYSSGNYPGGGGGGAGSVGGSASSNSVAGSGGSGSNAYASWANATLTGVSGFFAGGGGAGTYNGGTLGSGGSGGGGAAKVNGTANTGGGGGGGTRVPNVGAGRGGSGIVIVRYAV